MRVEYDAMAVSLIARPAIDVDRARARGTGANEAIAEDEEITTVPRWRTSDEMVTHRLATAEPAAPELPLPAPVLETPVRVEVSLDQCEVPAACSEPECEPVPQQSRLRALPLDRPPTRGWAWAVVTGALLTAATFAWIEISTPADRATNLRVRSEPAAPVRMLPPAAAPPRRAAAPVVAPVVRTEIMLHVSTEPLGATVVLDGVRLGTTPFVATVPVRSKPAWLKVRHRGSVATKTQVVLDRDVTWFVRLRAVRQMEVD